MTKAQRPIGALKIRAVEGELRDDDFRDCCAFDARDLEIASLSKSLADQRTTAIALTAGVLVQPWIAACLDVPR